MSRHPATNQTRALVAGLLLSGVIGLASATVVSRIRALGSGTESWASWVLPHPTAPLSFPVVVLGVIGLGVAVRRRSIPWASGSLLVATALAYVITTLQLSVPPRPDAWFDFRLAHVALAAGSLLTVSVLTVLVQVGLAVHERHRPLQTELPSEEAPLSLAIQSAQALADALNHLIDGWCARRAIAPLRAVLPAWPLVSGLTDDWGALLTAIRSVEQRPDQGLTPEELELLGDCRRFVEGQIYGER